MGLRRDAMVDRRKLLVEALREDFVTTGPKVGCATGGLRRLHGPDGR